MANAIVLKEKEKEAIINFYYKNIEAIKEQLESLEIELSDSYARFAELTGTPHPDIISKDITQEPKFITYSITLPLWVKVKIALQNIDQLSTTRIIAEYISKKDMGEIDSEYTSKLIGKIGATLKPKVDNNIEFDRVVVSPSGESYWGLKDWFEEKGKPKIKYRY